ncbi:C40 family peptidase [Mucilaginibacter ginsenosidivorax]|uniref:NlpC/P60 family protein n=1 Tax=Mucilaginibacter ginsenosidivorax TaxID=862126 RepID=A0A5B8VYY9_9SPHI|nr:C40 family peptidase [Mucilaginibacter ginsenosidivorax]QEC76679.1 NlpC/P60 family protein [Mucilaginibacter ginsenosidivorax]
MRFYLGTLTLLFFLISANGSAHATRRAVRKNHKTTKSAKRHKHFTTYTRPVIDTAISTGCASPEELITFAKSLQGIRYRFGSTNPEKGFDCSGFVNYVFNHFGISIPRSSVDFTDVQGGVDLKDAKFGDLILFTGTKKHTRRAGHIGIIVSMPGEPIQFIHSTSGEANGVTLTTMNDYYMGRYMRTIRVFSDNNQAEAYPETASR